MRPKDSSARIESEPPVDDAPPPDAEESSFEARIIDEHAAGEIAQHWYEQMNWPRLAAVLTDREMLEAILIRCGCCETNVWWGALERETGVSMEVCCEAAWRRWALDESLEETGDCAARIVTLLCCAGRFGGFTERLARTSLRIDAALYGDESGIVGANLDMLAQIFDGRGDYVVAEELAWRALAIAEKLEGRDSWITWLRLNTLAGVLVSREEYGRAVQFYRRALAIVDTADPNQDALARVLHNLSYSLMLNGNLAAAEPLARRALDVAETLNGPDHPSTRGPLGTLIDLLAERGEDTEAELLCRRRLEVTANSFGPNHPLTMAATTALARMLTHRDKFEEAEVVFRRALAVAELVADPDGSNVCRVLSELVRVLVEKDRNVDAEPLLLQIVSIREDLDDVDPTPLLFGLQQLGVLYRDAGRFEEAGLYLERAKALIDKLDPPDLVESARVLSSIGQLRILERRFDEAELLLRHCLEIRRSTLAPDDPAIALVEERLATLTQTEAADDALDSVPI